MAVRKYASVEERDKHWQSILDKNADNCKPELSLQIAEETGVNLQNNEVKASDKKLFNPDRAKIIFNHVFDIIEG